MHVLREPVNLYSEEFLYSNPIIQEDCLQALKQIPTETIHLALLDPPYKMGPGKFENKKKSYSRVVEAWDNEWEKPEDYTSWAYEWIKQTNRVLVNGGAILVFCSHHNLANLKHSLDQLMTFRNLIPWYVTNAMPILYAKKIGIYAHSCQYILYYSKGPVRFFDYDYLKKLNDSKQHRDIFIEPSRKHNKTLKHPTRKPDSLIEKLIQAHSKTNDIVLDFFLGSGTTALQAKLLGRRFVGVERNPEYIKEIKWRLDNDE